MRALVPTVRQQASFVLRPRLWHTRFQHTEGGHKYYFQNPGQAPVPDPTPYAQPSPIPVQPVSPAVEVKGPSLAYRGFKSTFWATLFTTLGLGAGAGLITWEYLQPPLAPGSEEEKEILEDIDEALDTHPLVQDLRNQGWREENFHAEKVHRRYFDRDADYAKWPDGLGLEMAREKLAGVQGLTMKWFQHPTDKFSILVCFLGFGVEGWPDTIHGGIITTLLEEAMQKHVHQQHPDLVYIEPDHISIDFKKPVRPGEIYAILVPPSTPKDVDPEATQSSYAQLLKRYVQTALFLSIEAAPQVSTSFDASTRTNTYEIGLSEAGSADPNTFIHAMAVAEIELHPTARAADVLEEESGRPPAAE